MKRRQFIGYSGAGLLSYLLIHTPDAHSATSNQSLNVKWLGHSCFLFSGSGFRVLVNPFEPLGCTAGYKSPKVEADLVLVSSRLLDEGAVTKLPGKPKIITDPGVYQFKGVTIQGISAPHDREGGRRFGVNTAWGWTQGGIKILHMGGSVAPVGIEQRILMGSPDLLLIPVGGGLKSYTPEEAKQAMEILQPKVLIPTQYLTNASKEGSCDLLGVQEFLKLTEGMSVQTIKDNSLSIKRSDLPKKGTLIRVMGHENLMNKST